MQFLGDISTVGWLREKATVEVLSENLTGDDTFSPFLHNTALKRCHLQSILVFSKKCLVMKIIRANNIDFRLFILNSANN